jgi:mediator of RNA polymerase II transcription subunit 7
LTTATNTAASLDARDGTHYDHALELKRLVKSLLVNFLELTGTLARNPAHAAAKVDDLRTLLINIHHALNEYRPHQARESAAEMMQEHLDRTRRETVAVRSQVDRARRVLEGLGSLTIAQEALLGDDAKGGGRVAAAAAVDQALERDKARETEVWAEVDALFA